MRFTGHKHKCFTAMHSGSRQVVTTLKPGGTRRRSDACQISDRIGTTRPATGTTGSRRSVAPHHGWHWSFGWCLVAACRTAATLAGGATIDGSPTRGPVSARSTTAHREATRTMVSLVFITGPRTLPACAVP